MPRPPRMPFSPMVVAFAACLAWSSTAAARGESIRTILATGKRSTAMLETPDGSGSAFCVHASGLFVTNAHVVRTVREGDEVTLVVRSGMPDQLKLTARVVRRDEERDLALLQAAGPRGVEALELGDSDELVETDQVIAFGYPLGKALAADDDRYPTISVTIGRVNAIRRKDGAPWRVQLDAVLTPGSSGGPIMSMDDEVVGIICSGVLGLGLNFAIPSNDLVRLMKEPVLTFDAPALTPSSLGRLTTFTAHVVSRPPTTDLEVSLELRVGERSRTLSMIRTGTSYMAATVPMPSMIDADVQVRIELARGSLVGQVEDRRFAVGARAVRLKDVREMKRAAGGTWRVEMMSGESYRGALRDLGGLRVDLGGLAPVVDVAAASSLTVMPGAVPAEIAYTIRVRRGDETVLRRDGVIPVAGGAAGGAVIAARDSRGRVEPDADVEPAADPPVPVPPPAPPAAAPRLAATRVVPAPSPFDHCVPGGGGRYVVCSMKKVRKLAIFDVHSRSFTKYIALAATNVLFTAGRSRVLVAYPDNGMVMRYSLATGERELAQRAPVTGIVQRVEMGANSEGPVLMRWATGTDALDRAQYAVIDLLTLRKRSLSKPVTGHNGCFRDRVHLRASADGTTFGVWATSHSPSGLGSMVLGGGGVEANYEHTSVGAVVPGPRGQYLYTNRGVYSANLKQVMPGLARSGQAMVPALDGNYFLGFSGMSRFSRGSKKVTYSVYLPGNEAPLVTEDVPQSALPLAAPTGFAQKDDFSFDRRAYFIPSAGALAIIPGTNDKIVLHPLDVMSALRRSGIDYLFVASTPVTSARRGRSYTYKIEVASKHGGVNCRLESGPQGMRLSSSGTLTWRVPHSYTGVAGVIVLVKDRSGQERFHTFQIAVE